MSYIVMHRNVIHALVGLVVVGSTASAEVKLYWTATDSTGAYVVRANADGSSPTNIVSGAAKSSVRTDSRPPTACSTGPTSNSTPSSRRTPTAPA